MLGDSEVSSQVASDQMSDIRMLSTAPALEAKRDSREDAARVTDSDIQAVEVSVQASGRAEVEVKAEADSKEAKEAKGASQKTRWQNQALPAWPQKQRQRSAARR